jgi:hypothetical protein
MCQNDSPLATQTNVARGLTLGLAAVAITSGIAAAVVWARHGRGAALACAGAREGMSCAFNF